SPTPRTLALSQLCSSLRRSMTRSALATFGSIEKENILPACSQTKKRLTPGAVVSRSGLLKVSLGNARSNLYGGGGSGEPCRRDIVQSVRLAIPNGLSFWGWPASP